MRFLLPILPMLFILPATAEAASCNLLDSSRAVPAGYGAAYNVFSSAKELLVSVSCTSSQATLTAGSGAENQYVYRLGYTYRNNQWHQIPLTGSNLLGGAWYVGQASARLPQTAAELEQNNFAAAYVCQWINGVWRCGCRDSACAQGLWQLQGFQKNVGISGDYATTVLNSNPVAYWPLNDTQTTATAATGPNASYRGTTQRGRTPTIVAGDVGGATARLNGTHDWIEAPHSSAMNLSQGAVFGHAQIDTWKERQTLVSKGNLHVELRWSKIRAELNGAVIESSLNAVPIEESFFWALSWGPSGMKLYVGTAPGSASVVAANASATGGLANSNTLYIGQRDEAGMTFHTRLYGIIGHVAMLGSQPSNAAMAQLANPQTQDIYEEDKSYRGQFLGQAIAVGTGGNTTNTSVMFTEFTPPRDGNIKAVRLNLRQGTGYSEGDGGVYDWYIVEVDPATNKPGTAKVGGVNGLSNWAPGNQNMSRYEYVPFSNPIPVEKGKRYAVAMHRVGGGHSSLNQGLFALNQVGRYLKDHLSDPILRNVWSYTPFVNLWFHHPLLRGDRGGPTFLGVELDAADFRGEPHWVGGSTGFSGRWWRESNNKHLYGTSNMARMRFTPGYTAKADGIWVNVFKRGSAGGLEIKLSEVGGATLETVSVPAAKITNVSADLKGVDVEIAWNFAEFSTVHTLSPGKQYELLFTSPGSPDASNSVVISPVGLFSRVWEFLSNYHPGYDLDSPAATIPTESWSAHDGIPEETEDGGASWHYPENSTWGQDIQHEYGGTLLRLVP